MILAFFAAAVLACSPEQSDTPPEPARLTSQSQPSPSGEPSSPSGEPAAKLVRRGKSVYNQICIACHAPDPNLDGNVGPVIAGASLALLRAKVLRNEYPPDHIPKRDTLNMVPLPHLERDLPALAAYLASVQE